MNDLASFRANEEKVFQAITELNRKKAQLEKESKMLDQSLISVKGSNCKLINDVGYLEGVALKLEKEVEDLNTAIDNRTNNTRERMTELQIKYDTTIEDENVAKRDQEKKIHDLEVQIRELLSQTEEIKSKKKLLVETVKKNVCTTIYDVLVENKEQE